MMGTPFPAIATTSTERRGQIYEIPEIRDVFLGLLRLIPGLTDDERYLLGAIIGIATSTADRLTDQFTVAEFIVLQGKKLSPSTVKVKILKLYELGLFTRREIKCTNRRPMVVFTLSDLNEMMTNPKLATRQQEISSQNLEPLKQSLINKDDMNDELLPGNDDFKHAYSRKINHVILRRCSSDPEHLGKRIPITLPGYAETVHVIQRTASGIPPMDGSEDRLQQALLTMFKEQIKKKKIESPHILLSEIKNSWLIDLREVCKSMKLKASTGNMSVQAKRLFQLRYNTFEILFNPGGTAAAQLNLRENNEKELYLDHKEQTLHALHSERVDQYFLSKLEPVRDEIIWGNEQSELPLLEQSSKEPYIASEPDEIIYDERGRLFRFYRISFHDRVFQECIDDALGQIHMQPPTLLEEERIIARLLVYLAQRIFGKSRTHPFEATWGEIAQEIQPLKEIKLVFEGMQKVFSDDYVKLFEDDKWKPARVDQDDEHRCVVALHGYCFETIIPKGLDKKRRQWRLRVWRDRYHDYTGDAGPAAKARALSAMQEAKKLAGVK